MDPFVGMQHRNILAGQGPGLQAEPLDRRRRSGRLIRGELPAQHTRGQPSLNRGVGPRQAKVVNKNIRQRIPFVRRTREDDKLVHQQTWTGL
jgi:hypothetical protein